MQQPERIDQIKDDDKHTRKKRGEKQINTHKYSLRTSKLESEYITITPINSNKDK
jgi:hypothetical protein